MKLQAMQDLLQAALPKKRYEHSLGVLAAAKELAAIYEVDLKKTAIAALLHDCGREIPTKESVGKALELGVVVDPIEKSQPILLHAKLGVYYAKHKYGVADKEILKAIRLHTTGDAGMDKLAKIVYLADLIEPHRDYEGVEVLRELVKQDLDTAMVRAYGQTMQYLLAQNLLIHPSCVAGYNEIILQRKKIKA